MVVVIMVVVILVVVIMVIVIIVPTGAVLDEMYGGENRSDSEDEDGHHDSDMDDHDNHAELPKGRRGRGSDVTEESEEMGGGVKHSDFFSDTLSG